MTYIAALDYEHLDNGVFLASLGKALGQQEGVRSIIVHGESAYTERLIQTGIMREEAQVRCIKDLNRRLVGLFADHGVATIGLNGYQKQLVAMKDGELTLDTAFIDRLPALPVLLLSNLVLDMATRQAVPCPLPRYIDFLSRELAADEIFLFSTRDLQQPGTEAPESGETIPKDLKNLTVNARLTTPSAFANLPDLADTIRLEDDKNPDAG